MNLALLANLKQCGKRVESDAVTAQDLADCGIAEGIESHRTENPHTVAMAKLASLNKPCDTERNCGTCVRWLDCTTMHRAHKVSPNLSACENYERKI